MVVFLLVGGFLGIDWEVVGVGVELKKFFFIYFCFCGEMGSEF